MTLVLGAYLLPMLTAPFVGGSDMYSNLLPILHFRDSILHDHAIPNYTELWYGGRHQWQNPLWSFLYLPSTLAWLMLPIVWAGRVVLGGHILFAGLAAFALASTFVSGGYRRLAGALMFVALTLPALRPGHIEKILAWPWVLLGSSLLLGNGRYPRSRAALAGICLGVIALTGANYYVLYAAVLFLAILFSAQIGSNWKWFFAGASVGLLHLPSVWYLAGQTRGAPETYIPAFSSSLPLLINDLFVGAWATGDFRWEGLAVVGIGTLIALFSLVRTRQGWGRGSLRWHLPSGRTVYAGLAAAGLVFALLATGILYRGHHLLDTFRVPQRAGVFLALVLLLACGELIRTRWEGRPPRAAELALGAALAQVALIAFTIRPGGGALWIDDSGASTLAEYLVRNGAHDVWVSPQDAEGMVISVALTAHRLSLPNVYYGPMGQRVPTRANSCSGYSFDHILMDGNADLRGGLPLFDEIEGRVVETVPLSDVEYLGWSMVGSRKWALYRVRCTTVGAQ
jgi:hypothetical protein